MTYDGLGPQPNIHLLSHAFEIVISKIMKIVYKMVNKILTKQLMGQIQNMRSGQII